MNLTLKAVYFCATNGRRWGKGLTVKDAKKNAGLTTLAAAKKCEYYVQAAMFDNPSPEELDNLFACINANQIDGSPQYYQDERTDVDTAMIDKYHVGWITIEKNYENK